MWEEQKSRRFQELRQREGGLSAAELAELTLLVQELEAAEAAYLSPTTQRLRQEREVLEQQNRTLEALLHRKESLVRRLGVFLAEAQAERRAIERELSAVLAGGRSSDTDE
jgi:peroxiredoxin